MFCAACWERKMKKMFIPLVLGFISVVAPAQEFDCHGQKPDMRCTLPEMSTLTPSEFITAKGHWIPDTYFRKLFRKKEETELTCIRARVPQVSDSTIGYCLMASGHTFGDDEIAVSTDYLDVISWEKTKIVAQRSRDWETANCETQQYVIDFPSNTVTVTSTLSMGKKCLEQTKRVLAEAKQEKPTEVFTLQHAIGTRYASHQLNPFLGER
jgi:hypothetical protein